MKIKVASGDTCSYCDSIRRNSSGKIYRTVGFTLTVKNKDVTGVESINENNQFAVFPNPTDGKSMVLFDSPLNNATIEITNSTGVKILEPTYYSGNQIQLDISNQANGLYIIEVITNGEIYRAKLMKQ